MPRRGREMTNGRFYSLGVLVLMAVLVFGGVGTTNPWLLNKIQRWNQKPAQPVMCHLLKRIK
jgi:hypothetical protein